MKPAAGGAGNGRQSPVSGEAGGGAAVSRSAARPAVGGPEQGSPATSPGHRPPDAPGEPQVKPAP